MPINRIILYAHDVEATVRFYEMHFGFEASREPGDRIVELIDRQGGASLMVHPAAKGAAPWPVAGQAGVRCQGCRGVLRVQRCRRAGVWLDPSG